MEVVAKNHLQPPETMFLPQTILKIYELKAPNPFCGLIFHSHVICVSFLCAHILSICIPMPFVYKSYVLIRHLYFTHMQSYVIRMSLVSARISSVCHLYVLVCHLCVTCMYSYFIRMSLVCTRMSSVFHSYVLVCYAYVTRMYSYVIRMSLVCTSMSSLCQSYVVLP